MKALSVVVGIGVGLGFGVGAVVLLDRPGIPVVPIEIEAVVAVDPDLAAGSPLKVIGIKKALCPQITASWGWSRKADAAGRSAYDVMTANEPLPNLPLPDSTAQQFERLIEMGHSGSPWFRPPKGLEPGLVRLHGELRYGGDGCERVAPVVMYGPWQRWD